MTSGLNALFPAGRPVRRAAAAFLAAAFAAAAAWLGRSSFPPQSQSPDTMLSALSLDRRPEGVFVSDPAALPRAEVVSVVDGDTLRVIWRGREERLRYYGVNTPEKGEPCYEEATRRNAALAGREVLLAFDERPRDKYGRVLAYIFTPEGRSVDGALVAEGLGRAWTRNGRWRDGMEALEGEARRDRRGCLWEKSGAPRVRARARRRK